MSRTEIALYVYYIKQSKMILKKLQIFFLKIFDYNNITDIIL